MREGSSVPRPESSELAALDDALAAIDQQREAVAVIAARSRGRMRRADIQELETILAACDRISEYIHQERLIVSRQYQKRDA